jgi:hypothetical protein
MKRRRLLLLTASIVMIASSLIGDHLVINTALAGKIKDEEHPPAILSISVCSPSSHGGIFQQGSCDPGTFDTHQRVRGPGGIYRDLL